VQKKRFLSEDIDTIPVRGNPECGTAATTVFMAGIKQSFFSKVIITGQVFFITADRTRNWHDISRNTVLVVTYFSTLIHICSLVGTRPGSGWERKNPFL